MTTPEELTLKTEGKSMKLRQKEEAVSRLMMLNVPSRILRDFEQFGHIKLCTSPLGTYSELCDEMKKTIKAFEDKYDATVFMVVRCFHRAGLLDSLLFVSQYDEEWEEEKIDIRDGYIMTYTINHDHDFCSEFGSIVYARNDYGGIVRLN